MNEKKQTITDLKTFPAVTKSLEVELKARGNAPELSLTHMQDLSYKLWGLHKRKMCIIGARTSNAKSTMAINIASDIASQSKKVMFLSFEMPSERIIERIFCLRYEIDNYDLLKNEYNKNSDIRQKFEEFKKSNLQSNLIISDCIGKDWNFIETILKNIGSKPDLVIIDHIQEIRGVNSQKQAIDDYISKIRESAVRNNFAVIMCSQVNRLSQTDKSDREPQLHHLKSSGAIEEMADQCILLHWAWHYDDSKDKNELIVNIAKNRDGMTGRIKMFFEPKYSLIRDFNDIERSQRYKQ